MESASRESKRRTDESSTEEEHNDATREDRSTDPKGKTERGEGLEENDLESGIGLSWGTDFAAASTLLAVLVVLMRDGVRREEVLGRLKSLGYELR